MQDKLQVSGRSRGLFPWNAVLFSVALGIILAVTGCKQEAKTSITTTGTPGISRTPSPTVEKPVPPKTTAITPTPTTTTVNGKGNTKKEQSETTAPWPTTKDTVGKFIAKFPVKPEKQTSNSRVANNVIQAVRYSCQYAGSQFSVAYTDYPESIIKSSGGRELILKGLEGGFRGKVLNRITLIYDNHPGFDLTIQAPDKKSVFRTKIQFLRNRLYAINVLYPESQHKEAKKFIDNCTFIYP